MTMTEDVRSKCSMLSDRLSKGLPEPIRWHWCCTGDMDPWGDNIEWWFAVNYLLGAVGAETNESFSCGVYQPTLSELIEDDEFCMNAHLVALDVANGSVTTDDLKLADRLFETADHALRMLGLDY